MRDFKKRYFLIPPLTDADLISLGLKPHDTTPTASGIPTAQLIFWNLTGGVLRSKTPKLSGDSRIARHDLGVKIIYVTGSPTDTANKGYRYRVAAPGESPPANPDDLRKSFYTKRKKDVIEFDVGDSGKTAYFAMQRENEGKKALGPLVSALIP